MTEKATEFLYRYRSWDKNVWCGTRQPDLNAEELAKGWDAWEFISEQKYNEICSYIAWEQPCHYQAEKLLVATVEHKSFDPVAYIERQKISIAESRKAYQERNAPQSGSAMSMSSGSSSSPSMVDGYGLMNLAEGALRAIGNGISSTVEVAGDCVEAIGEGISGMCE